MKLTQATDKSMFVEMVTNKLLVELQSILETQETINIAISGGSTPIAIFEALVASNFSNWEKISFYWVDERFVSHDASDNNAHNALKILGKLSAKGFYRMKTNFADAAIAAADYAKCLEEGLPMVNGFPQFDLILLGMGGDGHTASLFPHTDILNEDEKTVASVYVKKLDSYRVSLTYPTILNAKKRYVIIGGGKTTTLEQVQAAESAYEDFPIYKIMLEGNQNDEYLYY